MHQTKSLFVQRLLLILIHHDRARIITICNDDAAGLKPLVKDFQWKQFSRVLDIGGATGTVVAALAQQNPSLEGILFDQPQVSPFVNGTGQTVKHFPEVLLEVFHITVAAGD